MKKILELTGVQALSKGQQQNIKGAQSRAITCCGSGKCRISWGGGSFCEAGHCLPSGYCILY
ncbi:hypothetical protein [Aquimarina sediminis]|uniref:hypothetical protein n=1 Tax=Aquimarina sediminis TaxID=2070536 RepID=UPI000CA0540E|nr:hypothetical protein [Aquimarina sediminis]